MSVTKPYFIHIVTKQGTGPNLLGFKPPPPKNKTDPVLTAGFANVKRDPLNDKAIVSSIPRTYKRLDPLHIQELAPSWREYPTETIPHQQQFGSSFGFS